MPVVYDGVAGNPQGDLFQGLKLWISHRVPLRSKWVDLVTRNGGEVTQFEKNADMLIADNIKRGGFVPPPGSYSYQWIEFSIKNGQLENKDDYEIGQSREASRQIGSAQQTKGSRTAFTVKDDLILTNWVLAREWKGQAALGNEIYKELERQHPNHTWQSWRNRWVKKLKDGPRPTTSPEALELELEQHASDASDAKTPPSAVAMSTNQTKTSHQMQARQKESPQPGLSGSEFRRAKASTPPTKKQSPAKTRRFFTEEEDQLLMAFIQEARDQGKSLAGNIMYQQFAEEHPAHSWHSWRDRWLRHLSLRDAGLDNDHKTRGPAAQDVAQGNQEETKRQSTTAQRSPKSSKPAIIRPTVGPSEIASAETTTSVSKDLSVAQKANPRSDDERLKRQEETRRRLRAAAILQRTWRGHSVRRDRATLEADVVPLQSIIRGYLARKKTASRRAENDNTDQPTIEADLVAYSQRHQDDLDDYHDEAVDSAESMPQSNRDQIDEFYSYLQTYIEDSGADVDYNPSIRGHSINLWDLFRIATKQDCPPEHRDMGLVADEMGLEWRKFPDIVDKLQQCYDQNLTDFEDAIKTFENQQFDNDASSEDAEQIGGDEVECLPQTSDAVTALKEPVVEPSSPGYRSSPPVAGSKRSRRYADLLTSDPGYPSEGSRKRQRLDKNSVIPPTPEGKLGYSKKQTQRDSLQDHTSPLKPRGDKSELPIAISSGEESGMIVDEDWDEDDVQDELPSHSNGAKPKRLEPETQDWGFAPPEKPQESDIYESIEVDDVSPSQQLQMESNNQDTADQHKPGRRVAGTRATDLPSSPSLNTKASEHLAGGPRRSTRQRTAAHQSSTTASRSTIEMSAKKRALPEEYRQSPPLTARARESVPLLNSNPMLPPPPRPQAPMLSKLSATALGRTPKEAYRSYATSYTPSRVTPAANRPGPALITPLTPSVRSSSKVAQEVYDEAYVQAQVDHFEALGYDSNHVVQAMWAATFARGPQIIALESLHKGLGLPQNERGVWSEKDLRDLERIRNYEQGRVTGTDRDKMKVKVWNLRNRLTEKHGEEAMKARQELDFVAQTNTTQKGKARAA